MRILLALGAVAFLGGVTAACLFWAGFDDGAPIAFALGGCLLAIVVPITINQMGNWGVPDDEDPVRWRRRS